MGNLFSDSTWSYNVEYLGDFNHSAYDGNGIIIDHEDIDLLIQHWGGSEVYDYNFGKRN